jgi:hypothetical protein
MVVEKSNQAQQDILSLREELKEAKEERSRKVHYDEFTREMLKKTPKSRAEQITYFPFYDLLTLVPSKKYQVNWNN